MFMLYGTYHIHARTHHQKEYKNLTKWLENVLLHISCSKIGHTQKSNVNTQSFTLKHIDHMHSYVLSLTHTYIYT